MHTGADPFIIFPEVCVHCGHDPAVHHCQLRVRNDPRQMFGQCVKHKQKPGVNLTVASHLKFVVVTCGQELANCWDGGFISCLGVFVFGGHCT